MSRYFQQFAEAQQSKEMLDLRTGIKKMVKDTHAILNGVKWSYPNSNPKHKIFVKDEDGKDIYDDENNKVFDGYSDAIIETDGLHEFANLLRATAEHIDTMNVKAEKIKDEVLELRQKYDEAMEQRRREKDKEWTDAFGF